MNRSKILWKDIVYKGIRVSVSNYGNVKQCRKTKYKYDCNGYWYVSCNAKSLPVHHLVAKAFCSGYKYKCIPNHLDGNKKNNFYKNLKCGTRSDNVRHAYKIGLVQRGRILWAGINKKFVYKH